MSKNANESTVTGIERMVDVPLRVTPETIEENGFAGKISYVKIGYKRYPCIIGKVPESVAHAYMKMEWADVKGEERENRCLLPDGAGGFIMCPECNKCIDCAKVGAFSFDTMRPASLEALNEESDFEPEAPCEKENDEEAALEMMEILLKRLGEIKPRYALIFKELLRGNDCPLHISKELHLGKTQTYADVKLVRELAKRMYLELTQ